MRRWWFVPFVASVSLTVAAIALWGTGTEPPGTVVVGVSLLPRPAATPVRVHVHPPPPSPPPMAWLPCVDDSTQLLSDGDNAILCWDDACRVYDDHSDHDRAIVARPSIRKPIEEPPSVTAAAVCTGDHCSPVGPHLAEALASSRTMAARHVGEYVMTVDELVHATATRDHAVVVFRAWHDDRSDVDIWNVAADRSVTLGGNVMSAMPIGDLVLVDRVATPSILVDADGKPRGPDIQGGAAVQVGVDQFVVFGERGAVTTISRGVPVVTGENVPGHRGDRAIEIAEDRAAALVRYKGSWVLVTATHGRPRFEQQFPACR